LIDPTFNDRWRAESDATWGDRPGLVASVLRYRLLVVAATLLGALAGYGLAERAPVRYQADAVLILSDADPTVVGGGSAAGSEDRQVYLAKQVELMRSTVVLERAVELLGTGQSLDEVRGQLNVQAATNLATVTITATTGDPQSAAALANAVGAAYEHVTEETRAANAQDAIANLEEEVSRLQAQIDASPKTPDGQLSYRQQQLASQVYNFQQREEDIAAAAKVYPSGVENFEQAEPPTSPSQPKPKMAAAIGGLLGLLAAAAWAWWAAARDQRSEDRGDPARILEAPLLGEVRLPPAPKVAKGQSVTPPRLDPALEDAYHLIVASMEHELAEVSGKSIAVTSATLGATKTVTALQIANAASQQNRKVLLIDADVRMRHLSKRVGVPPVVAERDDQNAPMRWGATAGAKEYRDRILSTESGMVLPNPTDPWHPTGSYGAVDVRHAVRTIGELFDLVLIDAPPLLASSNALGVAGQADGVVLVVFHRITLSHLRDVRDRLAFVKAPLIGYVYVRPRGRGVGTLRERVTRPLRHKRAARG
jgi:tyrosine-protein kinase